MNSHKLSGSKYRKLAQEKSEKEEKIIASTRKLDSFFLKIDKGETQRERSEACSSSSIDNDPNTEVETTEASKLKKNEQEIFVDNDNPTNMQDNGLMYKETETSIEVSDDPATWVISEKFINEILKQGFHQNIDFDFYLSKRIIYNKYRVMSKSVFYRTLANGETQLRTWIIYSKSAHAVFCGPCKLFSASCASQLFTLGYSDWSNIYQCLKDSHKTHSITYLQRSKSIKCVENSFARQTENEIEYWRNVLKRIVIVIKTLATRGLPFRGNGENNGSFHNGNYMMALELIAEFDPLLSMHIKSHSNAGKGSVSYLSSTICDEFLELMAHELRKQIINEIKAAKYFSISTDSTPDISHTDQLTFIIRYIDNMGIARERFITLISKCSHKSEELTAATLTQLNKLNLDINNCRGQSYDNASNMSGVYSEVQARIKAINRLAEYVPCSAHSLILVGTCAAECCKEAVHFFSALQQLYKFFSASTHRWEILMSALKQKCSIKNLSPTRWSARHDACDSFCQSRLEILSVLDEISKDKNEKPFTRNEALAIWNSLQTLESCIIALFWNDILSRFNIVSKSLQSPSTELIRVVELYQSLETFLTEKRTESAFEYYERKARETCDTKEYSSSKSRKRKRKSFFDEFDSTNETLFDARENFRINVYYTVLDNIIVNIKKRSECYIKLNNKFGFLMQLGTLSVDNILEKAEDLICSYPTDLEQTFGIECQHFGAHFKSIQIVKPSASTLCKLICENDYQHIYPNVHIALCMYLCMMVTKCTGERSFSTLRRVKNYLRSTQSDKRLNALALLCIEAECTQQLNYNSLIDKFAKTKVRKVTL